MGSAFISMFWDNEVAVAPSQAGRSSSAHSLIHTLGLGDDTAARGGWRSPWCSLRTAQGVMLGSPLGP